MITKHERLLAAQMEIGTIKKDSSNPFYKSKYFDINSLLAVVKPILNKHGIILIQALGNEGNNRFTISTQLLDSESGAYLLSSTASFPEGVDPQKTGSAITYFRRYSLQSLLALEAEDDDANIASNKNVATKPISKPSRGVIDAEGDPTKEDNQDPL